MGVVKDLLQDVEIPKFYKVANKMDDTHIEDVAQAVRDALAATDGLVLPEGSYKCDENGNLLHGCVIAQIRDKVPTMVEYVDLAA